MAKHSKVKNTGILFELLVRQITTDTLNGVEKSPAIAIIKEYFGKRTTLKTKLPLYQTLLKGYSNPKIILQSRANIVEHVCKNIKDSSHVDRVVEAFRQEDKDLRLLAYKVLVDKFNSKYNKLSESQASILREYINNISNTENLRGKLQKVVAENLKVLQKSMKTVEDPVVKIKLKEVAKQIKNSVLNKKRIDEKKILNVLRLSELVEEVRNVG